MKKIFILTIMISILLIIGNKTMAKENLNTKQKNMSL